jgi:hypothetical protein
MTDRIQSLKKLCEEKPPRQQGKSEMQDILFMAHVRAVQDNKVFVIPQGDEYLEITVVRRFREGAK